MTKVVIIADDLTGALDSACDFATRGLSTRVALSPAEFAAAFADPAVRVVAYPTASREVSADDAAALVRQIMPVLKGFDGILFKKIDSRLKGNIAAELAVLTGAFARPALAIPAIPALGRLVTCGAVCGAGVADPIPVAPVLGQAAVIPDIETAADIDAALPADLTGTTFVGAAGLGAALARRLSSTVSTFPALEGPILYAIGSRDPVTLAQVAQSGIAQVAAPNGAVPDLPQGDIMVRLTQGEVQVSGHSAACWFANGIGAALRNGDYRTLFACGGETAYAILRDQGCGALDVLGEVLTGVPVARCIDTGMTVVTKSGGFGTDDLFIRFQKEIAKFTGNGVTTT